jgi:hypothetical protein
MIVTKIDFKVISLGSVDLTMDNEYEQCKVIFTSGLMKGTRCPHYSVSGTGLCAGHGAKPVPLTDSEKTFEKPLEELVLQPL